MCGSPLERGGGVCYTRAMKRWQTHPCHGSIYRAPSREGNKKILLLDTYYLILATDTMNHKAPANARALLV